MSELLPLIGTALLGTQRAPLLEIPAGTPLAELVASLEGVEPEAILLSAAGAMRLADRAGYLPHRSDLALASPPLDDLPPCSEGVSQHLTAMLDGRFPDLLSECLLSLAQAQYRLRDEMLVSMLEYGVKAARLRPHIIDAIGETGRWLAAQNPRWNYASVDVGDHDSVLALWQSVAGEQRTALLTQLRLTNPQSGLALIERVWKSEPAASRNKLMRILEIGLSAVDESFLEMALDDRDLTTRRTALDLLARMPGSRLMQRMTAYASDLLDWKHNRQRLNTITFPEAITPQMLRDGVPAGETTKLRMMQLTTIIGAVPLTDWAGAKGSSPAQLVKAILSSTWPRSLIRGFALAAVRQQHAEWARELLVRDKYSSDTIRLVSVLAAHDFEQLVLEADTSNPVLDGGLALRLLYYRNAPWSTKIAQRWMKLFIRHLSHVENVKPPSAVIRAVVKKFGRYAPVDLADEAATLLSAIQPESVWWGIVQEAIAMLHFRKAMLAEIHEKMQSVGDQS